MGDIYNYNKIGVRLGIGKKEKVITTIKDTSWESTTVIETISSNSAILPLLIILASKMSRNPTVGASIGEPRALAYTSSMAYVSYV